MKRNLIMICLLLPALLAGCVGEEPYQDTPRGNFEQLWKIIDENYSFFSYKDIDWNDVYARYSPLINPSMTSQELFDTLGKMLMELKDGHVSLSNGADVSNYKGWYENYPANFDEYILRGYLRESTYHNMEDARYCILKNDIGYVHYASFSNSVGNADIDRMLEYMLDSCCKGLIIDIRNNGGGSINNANMLVSHLTDKKVLVGYIIHKTGKGWDEFSAPKGIYLDPSRGVQWLKPVVVLTNRQTYSAANNFTNSMKALSHVVVMGDRTGGGSGLPFTSELSNGWSVRFSASPHLSLNKEHIEFGIEPDIKKSMDTQDEEKGLDTIIEAAYELLSGID